MIPIKHLLRRGFDLALWQPGHIGFAMGQVMDRRRNERRGYTDDDHVRAAAAWLARAQDATGDGGVAGRYFVRGGWSSSYPETTGYLIPTFLRLADEPGLADFRERAGRAARFLLGVQLASGAFPGMEIGENRTEPSIFNTAQILNGLVAWHAATGDGATLDAARRAAVWLVEQQDEGGVWSKHAYYGTTYTYMSHAACWLAEFGARHDYAPALAAASKHIAWVRSFQDAETGWFDKCGFTEEDHRQRIGITHTIAYTIWGVLMTSRLTGDAGGVEAAARAARAAARRLELSRRLPGVLDHRWKGRANYVCLTGNAQFALIWLDLHAHAAEPMLVSAAAKALDDVKEAQPMESADSGLRGGIAGSFPIWGGYVTGTVPNWAAKFFIDAMFALRDTMRTLKVAPASLEGAPAGAPTSLPPVAAEKGRSARVVLYASASHDRALRMLKRWSKRSIKPDTVVIMHERIPALADRVLARLTADGPSALVSRVFTPPPRARATPMSSAPAAAEQPGKDETLEGFCATAGIAVVHTPSADDATTIALLRDLGPDLAVYAASGILRKPILDVPRLGTLNAHMGLLPPFRGFNVAEWSRLLGAPVGSTVHLMDPGIDTGDILLCRVVPPSRWPNILAMRADVDAAQMDLLGEVVEWVQASGELPPRRPQRADEGRQYFAMHPSMRALLDTELLRLSAGSPG